MWTSLPKHKQKRWVKHARRPGPVPASVFVIVLSEGVSVPNLRETAEVSGVWVKAWAPIGVKWEVLFWHRGTAHFVLTYLFFTPTFCLSVTSAGCEDEKYSLSLWESLCFLFFVFNPTTGLSFSVMLKGFDPVDKIIYFPQYKVASWKDKILIQRDLIYCTLWTMFI